MQTEAQLPATNEMFGQNWVMRQGIIPRNIEKCVERFQALAKTIGEEGLYSWAVKNSETGKIEIIEGPSIILCEAAFLSWENLRLDIRVEETPTSWIFTTYLLDLEQATASPRVFLQSKGRNVGMGKSKDTGRRAEVAFVVGESKSRRNAIYSGIGRWHIDAALEHIKLNGVVRLRQFCQRYEAEHKTGPGTGLTAARHLALEDLLKVGVTREMVTIKFDCDNLETLTEEQIVMMRSDFRNLKSRAQTIEDLYAAPDETQTGEDPISGKSDKLSEALAKARPTGDEQVRQQRAQLMLDIATELGKKQVAPEALTGFLAQYYESKPLGELQLNDLQAIYSAALEDIIGKSPVSDETDSSKPQGK